MCTVEKVNLSIHSLQPTGIGILCWRMLVILTLE